MPRANSTAPAVNVKESEKAYTMELAAPGIKKECHQGHRGLRVLLLFYDIVLLLQIILVPLQPE